MGINLGIWGPVQWTEDDYNTLRPYLAKAGNDLLDYLDIKQSYFEKDLTIDNFMFYDSEQRNKEVQSLTAGHYASIGFVSFLLLSVIFGTIYQLMKSAKKQIINRMSIDEEAPRRPTFIQKYLNAFGAIENGRKLFFARSSDGDKNLELLNGLRVISMLWIILGHSYFYMLEGALLNPLVPLDFFKMFSFNIP